MPHGYPIMLDVADRLIVIVGGGTVAVRKAALLVACGATRIRCVAPEIDPSMAPEVERVIARYEPRHLDGATLVFAATDRADVNAAVVRDARMRNQLVNRADDPADFVTPARFSEAAATVTVAAGSPALSAYIRDRIAERWEPRWSQMADAMLTLRPMIVSQQSLSAHQRQSAFRALASDDAMNVLAEGGVSALRAWLAERFPELSHA